jgi:transcription initiation factor TFIIH subunit 2
MKERALVLSDFQENLPIIL